MSFDSEFVYTLVVTALDGQISTLQSNRNTANAEISDLGNVDASLSYIAADKTATLNTQVTSLNGRISNLNSIKAKIDAVEALSGNSKTTIYDFYSTYVIEEKKHFMSRLLDHSAGILEDAGNVIAGNVTLSEGRFIANLICENYPRTSRPARWVHTNL